MARRFLAIAFVLAALAPGAFARAQSTQGTQSTAHGSASSKTASSSKTSGSHTTNRNGHNMHSRHGNVPPWANSVYVNGGTAAQYLATPKPKPPPGKNKVNTGGQVFKSISN
jgi:hypothetical protein